ncbi:MAG: DUF4864 domain-containing protein, partial [Ignavibacteria bacterium]|nr:DUF4864 domain-containing protein [Ignavibacteria bacterium]
MRTRGFTIAAAGVLVLSFTAALTGCQTEGTDTRRGDEGNSIDLSRREKAAEQPDPSLSPQEVVKIQLHALKNNDEADNGIRIAFRFASPGNQAATGPLDRFIALLKGPSYGEMLNYVSGELG